MFKFIKKYRNKLRRWQVGQLRIGMLCEILIFVILIMTPFIIFFDNIADFFNWFGDRYKVQIGKYIFAVMATWVIFGKKMGKSEVNSPSKEDDFGRLIGNMMMWVFLPLALIAFGLQANKDHKMGRGRYNKWWKDFFMLFVSNMTWVKREWVEFEKTKQEVREDRLKKLLKKDPWWKRKNE